MGSRWGRAILISGAAALVTPAAFAGLLAGTNAAVNAGSATMIASSDDSQPAPSPKRHELDTLGRANAVAWISAGHVSAVP